MRFLRLVAASLCFLFVSFAQNPRKDPAVYTGARPTDSRLQPLSRSYALASPRTFSLGALSEDERKLLGPVGFKQRIGVHRQMPSNAPDSGTWTTLPDGGSLWQLAVRSDGAAGVRIHFSDFSAGAGQLWIYSGDSVDGPYTGDGPYGNGDFWNGTVEGESVIVEYAPAGPAGSDTPLPFRMRAIAHQASLVGGETPPPSRPPSFSALLADTSTDIGRSIDFAASCNLDVKCYPDWQDSKRSVAHIQFEETQGAEQGTFVCSASLVATRDNSFKPYLLTAGHCIHDEAAARSLQTFWQYESTGCNQGPPSGRGTLNSANGGHLLAWGLLLRGDYSLVLLPDVPSGVMFAGWDTADPGIGSNVTGVHHPMGSYKRISFGLTAPSADVDVEGDPAPGALYTTVNYNQGITQPGSSGSPLFSAPGVVIGMLTYGPAEPGEVLCHTGDTGGYGKFSNAYNYLRDYLEDLPFSIVSPSTTSLSFTGHNHAITGNTAQTVTLTTQAASGVTFKAVPDASWAHVSADSGTVSASSPFQLQVTVDPNYLIASDTYTTTIAIQSGAAPPQFINVKATMKIDTSNVTASAIPNPVVKSGGRWTLKLHLDESNGAATTLTALKIDGVDYSANIATWFGTNRLEANGSLEGMISTSGLVTPVDKFFEFFGQDVASGQRWYQSLTVTFK
ncbi:MAG TPA: hypothetical protein VEU96_11185 [Bryobacteraceae bacterium]|nr:hypothetical protein [Bryobacteraceae bacterium]